MLTKGVPETGMAEIKKSIQNNILASIYVLNLNFIIHDDGDDDK